MRGLLNSLVERRAIPNPMSPAARPQRSGQWRQKSRERHYRDVDGDRVVLLGDTFIEREGQRGFIEAALVPAHPEASLTFRNLGWSGDTIHKWEALTCASCHRIGDHGARVGAEPRGDRRGQPAGLVDSLSREELEDVVRFSSEFGS